MSQYTRPHIAGAAVFFTVAVAARGTDVLTTHIEALRAAVRDTRAERPFGVAAWVVLPDHMHCVWQLPMGDSDYSVRMGAIKARFSMALEARNQRASRILRREKGIWQRRFYEHHIRDENAFRACVR
ncbi:REP-associated tyrosine transposase [Pseudorhodobacter ferrugineus]|nr:transposase [Pseudorhodobacter ferrugineus]